MALTNDAFTRRWVRVMGASIAVVASVNAALLALQGDLDLPIGGALIGCAALALVGWGLANRRPQAALVGLSALCALAIAVLHLIDPAGDTAVYYALPAALFTAGLMPRRHAAITFVGYAAVVAAVMVVRPYPDPYWSSHVTDALLIVGVGAWAILALRGRAEAEAEQLRALAAALEASNQAKARFLATMSHELRTPLNAVIGYAELLREDADEGRADDLGRIEAAGRHLLGLIDDVLDIARVDSGGRTPHPEPVALAALAAEVTDWVSTEAQRRGVALSTTVDGPPEATVDRTMLRQILVNLVNNALRHADGSRVAITLDGDADTLRVAVTDDGVGIPPAEHDRIFAPFHQVQRAGHAHSGTGLGLAVVARFADVMGGAVALDPTPARGARFVVTLPRNPVR